MDIITVVFFLFRHLQTGRNGQNKKKNKDHCTGLIRWRDWLNPPADWLNPPLALYGSAKKNRQLGLKINMLKLRERKKLSKSRNESYPLYEYYGNCF